MEALIERRKGLGLDRHDEVWEGVYHVAHHAHSRHGRVEILLAVLLLPYAQRAGLDVVGAFNLGLDDHDFRVPDLGVREPGPDAVYIATAAMVVEILSPDDETFAKFDFYASRGVREILVVDPDARTIRCWHLVVGEYREKATSSLLSLSCSDLQESLAWP